MTSWVIVGSGPSAKQCPEALRLLGESDVRVMVINANYRLVKPDAVYAHDPWFWRKHYQECAKFGVPLYAGTLDSTRRFPKLEFVRVRHRDTVSLTTDYVTHGGNSGHQALHLLSNQGFSDFGLIGFDMNGDKGKRWCPDYKPGEVPPDYAAWRRNMRKLAAVLKKRGATVADLAPDGALDCFPKQDALAWVRSRTGVEGEDVVHCAAAEQPRRCRDV